MKFVKTGIEGVAIVEPRVFEDERGYFFESYNEAEFIQIPRGFLHGFSVLPEKAVFAYKFDIGRKD